MTPEVKRQAVSGLGKLKFSVHGQDSEFFIWDKEKDEVVSAHYFFPQKEDAKTLGYDVIPPIPSVSTTGHKVFRDGLAVEVNTGLANCIAFTYNDVHRALRLGSPKELTEQRERFTLTTRPWVKVTEEMVAGFPPDLLELGCMPTLDVYKGGVKTVDVNPKTIGFRTSGSHLHMSMAERLSDEAIEGFIKISDLMIGVPFALIFHDRLEFQRRQLYGQAGEFRIQEYSNEYSSRKTFGLEYRVLSSRVWDHPALWTMFGQIWKYFIGNAGLMQVYAEKYDPAWQDTIREAINVDSKKAREDAEKLFKDFVPLRKAGKWDKFPYFSNEMFDLVRSKKHLYEDGSIWTKKYPEAHLGFTEYAKKWQGLEVTSLEGGGIFPVNLPEGWENA